MCVLGGTRHPQYSTMLGQKQAGCFGFRPGTSRRSHLHRRSNAGNMVAGGTGRLADHPSRVMHLCSRIAGWQGHTILTPISHCLGGSLFATNVGKVGFPTRPQHIAPSALRNARKPDWPSSQVHRARRLPVSTGTPGSVSQRHSRGLPHETLTRRCHAACQRAQYNISSEGETTLIRSVSPKLQETFDGEITQRVLTSHTCCATMVAYQAISRQAWSLIHNRQRSPSVAVLRGALAAYPDLAGATLQYLQAVNAEVRRER